MNTSKQQQHHRLTPTSQSGFTIIESLIAIIVVTILMVGLAPIITLAVANRVQARRVELATQAASSYIDGVRSGAIPLADPNDNQLLKAVTEYDVNNPSPIPAPPKGNLNCTFVPGEPSYCTSPSPQDSILYCVDGDGDEACGGLNDFVVQAFGQIPTDSSGEYYFQQQRYAGYRLGVRVYRADAFTSDFVTQFSAEGTQLSAIGGTGLSKTQSPLANVTTEISIDSIQLQKICGEKGIDGC
jgi:prepilin-type N-terminal cleavage/methylation domain-containing protein